MTKHSPGPWEVRRQWSNDCEGCPHIHSADGRWVAEAVGAPYVVGAEPTTSNARLIAAAPDLLAALEALGNWLAYGLAKPDGEKPTADDHRRAEELAAQAAAAVRKAKGA